MSIIRHCPACGISIEITDSMIDNVFPCPYCETALFAKEKSTAIVDVGHVHQGAIPEVDPKYIT